MGGFPPVSLTAIGGGINRLRTKGGADKNSLFDLVNGYVTQAGTVKVRPGTFRNANIATYSGAGNTKGLVAYQDQFHIFSSELVPVPPGYALHILALPQASSLTNIVTAIPPVADPHWADVVLLQYFRADASDSSGFGHTGQVGIGAVGNPAAVNVTFGAGGPFSNGQANFAGNNCFGFYAEAVGMTSGDNIDVFATTEWTIEGWVNVTSIGSTSFTICDYGGSTDGSPTSDLVISASVNSGNNTLTLTAFDYNAFGTTASMSCAAAATTGTWHHFALVGHSGNQTLYLDGIAPGSRSDWNPTNYARTGRAFPKGIVCGSWSRLSGGTVTGSLSNFRVTAGLARYTANFTPPGAPFPQATYEVTSPQIKEIHFSAPYLGGLYVVAEFDVTDAFRAQFGDTFHYWIQSSTESDSSNAWIADTDYKVGDVVIPTTPNGFIYAAARKNAANPVWTPNTTETVGNIVEPTIANGFKYTVTDVQGALPTTGVTEPTWPTADGATVDENSALADDQSFAIATASVQPAAGVPVRYTNIAGGT